MILNGHKYSTQFMSQVSNGEGSNEDLPSL